MEYTIIKESHPGSLKTRRTVVLGTGWLPLPSLTQPGNALPRVLFHRLWRCGLSPVPNGEQVLGFKYSCTMAQDLASLTQMVSVS